MTTIPLDSLTKIIINVAKNIIIGIISSLSIEINANFSVIIVNYKSILENEEKLNFAIYINAKLRVA